LDQQKNLNYKLIDAVKRGDLTQVKLFVENGANINYAKNIALRYSAENGYLEIVKYIIECGINIHTEMAEALQYSARNGHLNIVKYLVEQGADIHTDNKVLIWSIYGGSLSVVKYLVDHGADINTDKESPLMSSAINGHIEIIKYLIFQCNIIIKEDTLKFFKYNNFVEVLNIINVKNLVIALEKKLNNNNIIDNKEKI
jgi:ankyrin repeat protein